MRKRDRQEERQSEINGKREGIGRQMKIENDKQKERVVTKSNEESNKESGCVNEKEIKGKRERDRDTDKEKESVK